MIAGTAAATGAAGFGIATSGTQGTNGETLASARSTYATDYNNLRTQIDQLATDASFNGINLLNGDSLTVKFNESGSSKLDITGVTYNAAGLGIAETTFSDIEADVALLDTATSTLRKQSSTFGANLSVVQNRQDFTKNLIGVLEGGAGDLTLADTNEEAANLLAVIDAMTSPEAYEVLQAAHGRSDRQISRSWIRSVTAIFDSWPGLYPDTDTDTDTDTETDTGLDKETQA